MVHLNVSCFVEGTCSSGFCKMLSTWNWHATTSLSQTVFTSLPRISTYRSIDLATNVQMKIYASVRAIFEYINQIYIHTCIHAYMRHDIQLYTINIYGPCFGPHVYRNNYLTSLPGPFWLAQNSRRADWIEAFDLAKIESLVSDGRRRWMVVPHLAGRDGCS